MKKHFLAAAIAACGIMLPAAAGNSAQQFQSTMKHVDVNGEYLFYQNFDGIKDIVVNKLPGAVEIITRGTPYAGVANQATKSILKLFNLNAFKAFAISSVEQGDGIFVTKAFTSVNMKAPSIFIDPTLRNTRLDWQQLPYDTRLALKGRINLAHVWKMLYAEVKDNPDEQIKSLAMMIDMLGQQGIDIHGIVNSINGEVEILITGTTIDNVQAKISIPDANGTLSTIIKGSIGIPQDSNVYEIPNEIRNIKILFGNGKITAVTSSELLRPALKTIASQPQFRQYAKFVPQEGAGYFIIDIPQVVLNQIRTLIKEETEDEKFVELFDLFVQPSSLLGVTTIHSDGAANTIVSNFSIAQFEQQLTSGAAFIPMAAGILLPALEQARERGRSAACINNMKQLGLACMMYADDNNDTLPADTDKLKKNGYIYDDEIVENVIYLGYPKKYSSMRRPSAYPLAICESNHGDDNVCVLFADGHVENVRVNEYATPQEVVTTLYNRSPFPQEDFDYLLKKLAED